MPFKSCGRVGDSPLPGAGLYADNEVRTMPMPLVLCRRFVHVYAFFFGEVSKMMQKVK